jgi:hypothetical protein
MHSADAIARQATSPLQVTAASPFWRALRDEGAIWMLGTWDRVERVHTEGESQEKQGGVWRSPDRAGGGRLSGR